MKKVIILLLLMCMIATSVYALNVVDMLLYNKVLLKCIRRYVLVHRVTGQVEYIRSTNGRWVHLAKPLALQYQSMYEAQGKGK